MAAFETIGKIFKRHSETTAVLRLAFNNQLRRLILTMGVDGEALLELLDLVEKRGKHKLNKQLLTKLSKEYLQINEYDRSIKLR